MTHKQRIRRQSQDDHTTLPQFVLRGFVFQEPDGKRRHNCVYEFTKDGPEGESEHIKKVSTEMDFFGRPGEREVETKLSTDETRYAPLLAELRTGPSRLVPAPRISLIGSFVMHFLRSANLRHQLARYAECYFTIMAEELTPENIDLMLAEVFAKATAAAERVRETFRGIAFAAIQGGRNGALQKAESLARGARDIRHFGFDHEMIREMHLDQVAGEFGSYPLAQALAQWSWVVETAARDSFVLGDVGPLAAYAGVPGLHPLFSLARPGPLTAVWMPIAHDRVLIGWKQGERPVAAPDTLNGAAAEASRSRFIAHANDAREQAYGQCIGVRFYEPDLDQLRASFRARIRASITPPS